MATGTLRKDYTWNTIGVLAQNAISPLLLIVITRVNGIADSGLFSFAFSVAVIFLTLGMWSGRTYQVSDAKKEFTNRSYIALRILLACLMLLGGLLFAYLNGYDLIKTAIIVALVLYKVFESISDAIYGVLQIHGRLYTAGRSLFYKALGGLMIFTVIDITTHSILLGSIGIVIVNITFLLLYDLRISRKLEDLTLKKTLIKSYIRDALRIMKRSTPVFAVAFLATLVLNIPRYFIDKFHPADIGYFGIIAMPITVVVLLMSFVLQPNVVQLSRLYADKELEAFDKVVQRILFTTIIAGFIIFVGTFFVGIPVLNVAFNLNFEPYKITLLVMVVSAVINALVAVFINILTITRHLHVQVYVLLISDAVLLGLSALLIQRFGILGGAILFGVISLIQVLLLFVVYQYAIRARRDA